MGTENDDSADPVLDVLTEYEQKLRVLHDNDRLTEEAARTFGALVTDLERRSGRDRRATARAGVVERRQTPRARATEPA